MVFVVIELILKENVLKNRLIFLFINIVIFIVLFFIYEMCIVINEDWLLGYIIYLYFMYFVFLIFFYNIFRNVIINVS